MTFPISDPTVQSAMPIESTLDVVLRLVMADPRIEPIDIVAANELLMGASLVCWRNRYFQYVADDFRDRKWLRIFREMHLVRIEEIE